MRISRVLLTTALAAAGIGLAVPTAHADSTGTAQTSTMTVTYTIGDVRLDGPGCIDVPVTLAYTKQGSLEMSTGYIELELRHNGQSYDWEVVEFIKDATPASGTLAASALVCGDDVPANVSQLTVTGKLEAGNIDDDSEAEFSPSTVSVVLNPSTLKKTHVVRGGQTVRLAGAASAQTLTEGVETAEGRVRVEVKPKGAKQWTTAGYAPVNILGEWKSPALNTKRYPAGTAYRATLVDCGWCTDATATGTIR